MVSVAMTIAGSDSGGGAGVQADLKTFQELKVFGTSVITAVTAQNTQGVHDIMPMSESLIRSQIKATLSDFKIKAIKTGMLFSGDIIKTVAEQLADYDGALVIDPVMIAKGGASLLRQEAIDALIEHLIPQATVITPNIPEAEVLTGLTIQDQASIEKAARLLLDMGAQVAVIKGGHSQEKKARDYAFYADGRVLSFATERLATLNTHGTGCTFAAAIAAFIAQGMELNDALIEAKRFIYLAIQYDLKLGHGHGPTNHFAYQQYKAEAEVDYVWR